MGDLMSRWKGKRQSPNVIDSRGSSAYKGAVNTIESMAEWADAGNELSPEDILDYNAAVRIVKLTDAHLDNAARRTYDRPPPLEGKGPLAQLSQDSINGMTGMLYDYYDDNSEVPVPRPRPLGY
jgi:hypothetical protein